MTEAERISALIAEAMSKTREQVDAEYADRRTSARKLKTPNDRHPPIGEPKSEQPQA